MQKFYNIAFSYENKKLKQHACDVSISFDGIYSVMVDGIYSVMVDGIIHEDKHQMLELDLTEYRIFHDLDKFYILEKYKKHKFKYMVFCIDQEKEKINKNELKDFAFALFSGIILENFE